jgi:hypothetical protein
MISSREETGSADRNVSLITEQLLHSLVEPIRIVTEIERDIVDLFENACTILAEHISATDKRLEASSQRYGFIDSHSNLQVRLSEDITAENMMGFSAVRVDQADTITVDDNGILNFIVVDNHIVANHGIVRLDATEAFHVGIGKGMELGLGDKEENFCSGHVGSFHHIFILYPLRLIVKPRK